MSESKRNKPVAEGQVPEVPVENISEAPHEQPPVVKCRVNSESGLNLRPEPNKLKPALRVLPYEAAVDVRGEPAVIGGVTWVRVENGWCDSAFLTQISEEE